MNKPIHMPGPLYVSIVEHETPVLQSASLEEDNFLCAVEGRSLQEAQVNARLLCAAYNASESAARELGCDAVALSERMQEGEFAALAGCLGDVLSRFRSCIAGGNGEIEGDKEAIERADSILSRVKGGAS
jgi:hypothetical protein